MACSLTMNETLKRALVVIGWVSAVAGWVIYQRSTGLGTLGAAQSFIDVVRGQWWAIGAFILVYAARPLVLFPASLMTIAGGLLFGPVVGVIASVVGANASAMVAYWLARSLGFERADDPETAGIIARWSQRMRRESFVTVMVMRFAFLPYDLVNYAAGLLRIRPGAFLLATALGSLPGTISFSLAGASIESLDAGVAGVDPIVLVASAVLFVVSVGVSKVVQRRNAQAVAVEQDEVVSATEASPEKVYAKAA